MKTYISPGQMVVENGEAVTFQIFTVYEDGDEQTGSELMTVRLTDADIEAFIHTLHNCRGAMQVARREFY